MEAPSHCFTVFQRSHLCIEQTLQPPKHKNVFLCLFLKSPSPVAHLWGDFWTMYLPKQMGLKLNSCIKAGSHSSRLQNLQA